MSDLLILHEDAPGLPDTAVVVLRGSIDAKTVFAFQSKLNAVMERGYKRFIIDMEGVKYVNSTGLGFLINLSDTLGAETGEISLVRVQPKVKVVFDMLGLNQFFHVYNSREEAYATFAGAPAPEASPIARPDSDTVLMRNKGPGVGDRTTAVPKVSPPPPPPPPADAPVPVAAEVHAGTLTCGGCNAALIVREIGAYKCPRCFAIFQYKGNGEPVVIRKRKSIPYQMSLDFAPESVAGLVGFVGLLAARVGFDVQTRDMMCEVVRSTLEDLKQYAYDGVEGNIFHVLLMSGDREIEIRLADVGKHVDVDTRPSGDVDAPFSMARGFMDKFEITHQARGGNVVTLVKRLA